MRSNPIPVMAALLLFPLFLMGQDGSRYDLHLKSGVFTPSRNISKEQLDKINHSVSKAGGKSLAIVQFDQVPSETAKGAMRKAGLELLDYIPENAYIVLLHNDVDSSSLQSFNVRSLIPFVPEMKIDPELSQKITGSGEVWVSIINSYDIDEVSKELRERNFTINSNKLSAQHILVLYVSYSRIAELANLPYVDYVQAAPGPPVKLSQFWTQWGRDGVRASILNAPIAQGGKNLNGSGVTVGIGDDADPQLHIDFTGRMISRAATTYEYHGTHVAGIVGGAGIRNELRRGFASKSNIISQYFGNIILNAPAYVTDHRMVISNNSYGNNETECASYGVYDLYSRILDQQAASLTHLQTVFAAGNSGNKTCAPFPSGYRTVLGGLQSAKNVLTVGNGSPLGSLFAQSSRGPARDGRIKPEIVAVGSFIESTVPPPFDFYGENTGTSMASPSIAGGLALLYEQYRLLHADADPKNGLMKALVCNSGDDWGNPGPDYANGFGIANFRRAEDMLENAHYNVSSIAPGPDNTISVAVPAGLAQLKVMLYWNDPEAAAVSSQTLVNDLDLVVDPPSGPSVLPLILDTASSQILNIAHNGADHINNIEQVVINNPVTGNYTFRVKATNITVNPSQEYFLVYDFVPTETILTTPMGGETYLQGENVIARWDSYGDPANTFKLEFSSDNGSSWTTLKNNIAANKREYFYTAPDPNEWFIVPQVNTDKALMRISRNGTSLVSTSLPFVISDTLTATLSPVQCEGYISVDWNAIPNALGYEVMMLQGTDMVTIASLPPATLTYSVGGLSKDSTYWVSVRPLIGPGGSPGRRSIAVFRQPNNGTCTGSISDNDIKLDALLAPSHSGRKLTSTALSNSETISIRIKNLDDNITPGNITVGYILNNGLPVTATLTNPGIAAGGTLNYSFAVPADFSTVGSYTLKTFVQQAADPYPQNDTLISTIKQLDNPPVTAIVFPATFTDNFDASPVQSYTSAQTGLIGLDNYDFVNSSSNGRIRTFVNTGIAYSGNRALTLDAVVFNAGTTDSLTGTYNLATFDASSEDIRLDFQYKNHGQFSNAANNVWIRGDDTKPWVLAYDLVANQHPVDGTFKQTASIELSDLLSANSQNFSTSFQVRWGQYGQIQAADNSGGAGYTFDDVRLYKVTDDIQMISIDSPIVNSCGLSAATRIAITIRNSSNAAIPGTPGIPVKYRVNGGSWITETVPGLGANTSIQYFFTTTADMSAPGNYLIEAVVAYPTDSYPLNDTARINMVNTPVITVTNTTEYLQDFESGNGYWYTGGENSSWEYGTPASYKIKRAASGIKAWKTRLAGDYNDNELSYLYSPCYDISTVTNPTLSLSIALDLEDCGGSLCDGAYIEYSKDGVNWFRLGASGQGTNWYNKNYPTNNLWSISNYQRWHVATIPLSVIPGPVAQLTQLRFRFVVTSDILLNREGVAVDDIHIYNNPNGIYTGTGTSPVVSQAAVNGTGWVDFIESGSNQLIASVNPNGTNLGSTDVQSYVWTGAVRINSDQYYHNRNITIKPASIHLPDSASVRFYFLDSETELLINATGCSYCTKPSMAYELGVTKYSDPDPSKENGTLADNTPGNYLFINTSKIRMVPFDKGYYAEFKVKDFSEFWLNNGGINNNTPLPLKLLSFSAKKEANNVVLVEWKTAEEFNVNHFEIEVARGNAEYQVNHFERLGQVPSRGNMIGEQLYSFNDIEANKSGVRYYRLKMVDQDGHYTYSPIRPVVFSDDTRWQVYPNPSAGVFNFVYQLPDGQTLELKIFDQNGRVIRKMSMPATGFLQKLSIDLADKHIASGIYLLEAGTGERKEYFRLIKQ